jgi:ribosomal protein S6E (S10)
MGIWDRVRAALRREKRDLDEAVDEFQQRANAALDKREREQTATPEEKLAMQQERGDEIDAEFDAVRKRIEGGDSTA